MISPHTKRATLCSCPGCRPQWLILSPEISSFAFRQSWRCEHIDFSVTSSQRISLYVGCKWAVATSLCSPSLSLKLVLGPGVPVVPKTAEILFEIVAVYELRHHWIILLFLSGWSQIWSVLGLRNTSRPSVTGSSGIFFISDIFTSCHLRLWTFCSCVRPK